jgi:hypothetical protein
MKARLILPPCIAVIVMAIAIPLAAQAQDGLPNSPGFGYGVHLDLSGHQTEAAIKVANTYNLDWISIDIDWETIQPQADNSPDWGTLDNFMSLTAGTQLSVMVSLTHVPNWAMDATGPNPTRTTGFIREMVIRYPGRILALELLPGANTFNGWGTNPNPQAYAMLLQTVASMLRSEHASTTLVTGGLIPIDNPDNIENLDALIFLQSVYNSGAISDMPVIGLRLPAISHQPETIPTDAEVYTLRYYEEVRAAMLANQHDNGIIWVTGFAWQPGNLNQPDQQSHWLQKAYLTMRPQLYIGVAFFRSLNATSSDTNLITTDGKLHPAFDSLGILIASEDNTHTITQPIEITKYHSNKPLVKPSHP